MLEWEMQVTEKLASDAQKKNKELADIASKVLGVSIPEYAVVDNKLNAAGVTLSTRMSAWMYFLKYAQHYESMWKI
jgi:hypothetical protein